MRSNHRGKRRKREDGSSLFVRTATALFASRNRMRGSIGRNSFTRRRLVQDLSDHNLSDRKLENANKDFLLFFFFDFSSSSSSSSLALVRDFVGHMITNSISYVLLISFFRNVIRNVSDFSVQTSSSRFYN